MIRTLFALILILIASAAVAGFDGYKGGSGDEGFYDPASGLYFLLVRQGAGEGIELSKLISGNPAINLLIYDPATKRSRRAYEKHYGAIREVIVEAGYDAQSKQMVYISGSHRVSNNQGLTERNANPVVLIETYSDRFKLATVWRLDKNTGGARPLFNYREPDEWHVDAKNRAVRVIRRSAAYRIDDYAWR
ncbi:MAG TPA: hypothetical protein VLC08_06625 [Chitinolyticbacter sp.]|nr:hypothetical protein [Chitinolyticbacter sp.]